MRIFKVEYGQTQDKFWKKYTYNLVLEDRRHSRKVTRTISGNGGCNRKNLKKMYAQKSDVFSQERFCSGEIVFRVTLGSGAFFSIVTVKLLKEKPLKPEQEMEVGRDSSIAFVLLTGNGADVAELCHCLSSGVSEKLFDELKERNCRHRFPTFPRSNLLGSF